MTKSELANGTSQAIAEAARSLGKYDTNASIQETLQHLETASSLLADLCDQLETETE